MASASRGFSLLHLLITGAPSPPFHTPRPGPTPPSSVRQPRKLQHPSVVAFPHIQSLASTKFRRDGSHFAIVWAIRAGIGRIRLAHTKAFIRAIRVGIGTGRLRDLARRKWEPVSTKFRRFVGLTFHSCRPLSLSRCPRPSGPFGVWFARQPPPLLEKELLACVGVPGNAYLLRKRGSIAKGSRPGRTVGESVGGMF